MKFLINNTTIVFLGGLILTVSALNENSLRGSEYISPINTPVQSNTTLYDAIVIGGGWSGLSAAATLVDNGYDNILVLEARGRLGGRSHTVTDFFPESNIPVEFGSEFVYTDFGWENEIVDLFDREHVAYSKLESHHTSWAVFIETDGKMDDHIRDQLDEHLWFDFLDFARKQTRSTVDIDYDKLLRQYEAEKEINDELDTQFSNMLMNGHLVMSYATDPNTVSVRSTLDYWFDCSDATMALTSVPDGGFGRTIETFVTDAGIDDKILTNSIVKSIDYTDNESVGVAYVNKVGDLIHVKASTVLVTVPLGVLKSGSIQFNPALPEYKQEAIDTMQVGTLDKYVLFWDDDTMAATNSSSFIDRWDDIMDRDWLDLVTPETETSNIFTEFFNNRAHNGQYVLTAWIGGSKAKAMEVLEDDIVLLTYIMPNLRAIFGDDVPIPTKSVMTRWREDKYSQGSYSYPSVDVNFEEVANVLGSTIDNKLFFAGEHTSPEWHSTTVGAYQTGVDTATRMLNAM